MKELFTKLRALRYGVRLGKQIPFRDTDREGQPFINKGRVEWAARSERGFLRVGIAGRERALTEDQLLGQQVARR